MEITKMNLKKFLYIHLLPYLLDLSQLETDRKVGYYDKYCTSLKLNGSPPSLILGDDVTNLVYTLAVVYIVI